MHGTIGASPRVLLTSDAVGGVWRYSLAIAEGICARGGQCTLAIMGPALTPRQTAEAEHITGCTLIHTGLPLDWTASGRADMAQATADLGRLAVRVHAHTAHLHMPTLAAFDWPVQTVVVAHSCVGGWWQAVHGPACPPAEFRWRMDLMEEGLSRADAVIAPSRSAADALGTLYAARRPIDIVHNGLRAVPTSPRQRQRHVLCAGRLWDAGKNFAVLDRAAPLLNAPIYAAGPTHGASGAAFSATGLRLLGNLAQVALRDAMATTMIFAAPSVYEPFGLAVLEAAQTGAALVLADIAGFRELWDGAALFVDPHDAAAWAGELRALLDAPARAAALGDRARARSRRYTARAMVEATMAIHRAVALQAA